MLKSVLDVQYANGKKEKLMVEICFKFPKIELMFVNFSTIIFHYEHPYQSNYRRIIFFVSFVVIVYSPSALHETKAYKKT